MTKSITFPSASNNSKLSACPTTKVPQATDWIYQDFFNTMLNSNEFSNTTIPSIQISDLYHPNDEKKILTAPSEHKPYHHHLIQTIFSEALHVVSVEPQQHAWDNNIDYNFCPTSSLSSSSSITDNDQTSLPDLGDNIKSVDKEDFYTAIMLNNGAPVLIESSISTTEEDIMSIMEDESSNHHITITEENMVIHNNRINNQSLLKKRKSNSSFSSLKSFMNVFNKKSKLDHHHIPVITVTTVAATATKNNSMTRSTTLSKKFLKYFKRRS